MVMHRRCLDLQIETLQSKPGVLAAKDELERLIPLVQEAEKEAVDLAVQKAVDKALAQERAELAAQVSLFIAVCCYQDATTDSKESISIVSQPSYALKKSALSLIMHNLHAYKRHTLMLSTCHSIFQIVGTQAA